jgi:hypothetical protein
MKVAGKSQTFSGCKDNLPAYKVGGWVLGGVGAGEGRALLPVKLVPAAGAVCNVQYAGCGVKAAR